MASHKLFIVNLVKAFGAFCAREQASANLAATSNVSDLPLAETTLNHADRVYQRTKAELLTESQRLGPASPLPALASYAASRRGGKR